MKIFVASDGFNVSNRFVESDNFNFYTTESYEIIGAQNLPAQIFTTEEYASFMNSLGADVLICHDIDAADKDSFNSYAIDVVTGAEGPAIEAAQKYILQRSGSLEAIE